jgi:hypothetical protein
MLIHDDVHVTDFLAEVLHNDEIKSAFPLGERSDMLVTFTDGVGFEQLRKEHHKWIPKPEEASEINSPPGFTGDGVPVQLVSVTRKRVSIAGWGGVRIGYLMNKPIKRAN